MSPYALQEAPSLPSLPPSRLQILGILTTGQLVAAASSERTLALGARINMLAGAISAMGWSGGQRPQAMLMFVPICITVFATPIAAALF